MTTKRKLPNTAMESIKMEAIDNLSLGGADYMVAKGRLQGVLKLLTERSDSDNSSSHDGDENSGRKYKRRTLISGSNSRQHQQQNAQGSSSGQYRHTYVMKLFDRSVDLAKFEEDTPLYPICRAWMANQPRSNLKAATAQTKGAESNLWVGGASIGTSGDVYRLPPPQGPPICRAPSPTPEQREHQISELPINTETQEPAMDKEELIRSHLKRWVSVKRKWIRAAALHEDRYSHSKQILQAIYNKAQDTLLE